MNSAACEAGGHDSPSTGDEVTTRRHRGAAAALDARSQKKDNSCFPESTIGVKEDKPQGSWTAVAWLSSVKNSKGNGILGLIRNSLLDIFDNESEEIANLRRLGAEGDKERILTALRGAMDEIADVILDGAKDLCKASTLTGKDFNEKYMQESFQLAYGGLDSFFGGLEYLLGSPFEYILKGLFCEHYQGPDSKDAFTTDNYQITTTSRTELAFAIGAEGGQTVADGLDLAYYEKVVKDLLQDLQRNQVTVEEVAPKTAPKLREFENVCEEQLSAMTQMRKQSGAWPAESVKKIPDRTKCRQARPLSSFQRELLTLKALLETVGETGLTAEELIGARLYTGPMFVKYNATLRALSQNQRMVKNWETLCQGNRYITTIHVINSAFIKLSKIQPAQVVYRGMTGGLLPAEFLEPNDFNVRGGTEYAFMSTTTDHAVARFYASGDPNKAGLLFEIQLGMVDRGASLRWLSQYPHEAEICFGPLSGLEVVGTRVEGSMLIVEVRLNINMQAMTIEQVQAKRKKLLSGMTSNLLLEVKRELAQNAWGAWFSKLQPNACQAVKDSVMQMAEDAWQTVLDAPAEDFNDNEMLRKALDEVLKVRTLVGVRPTRKCLMRAGLNQRKLKILGVSGPAMVGVGTEISAGHGHSLLLMDGTVRAFGENNCSQCKIPDLAGKEVTGIAAGNFHSLLLLDDGTVRAFGQNNRDQCKIPDLAGQRVTDIAAGHFHNLLLLDDSTVRAFGNGGHGQCQIPDLAGQQVTGIAAGALHSLLLLDDGTVRAFGQNAYGQCKIPELAGQQVTGIAASAWDSLLLLDDGTVRAFGKNECGQCKIPDLAEQKVTGIAAGNFHSLLLLDDGTVRAFGYDKHGQCQIPDLAGQQVTGIAAGEDHSLLRLDDGTVRAFGSNAHGQCKIPAGDPVTTDR